MTAKRFTLCQSPRAICDYIDAGARVIVMYDIREISNHAKDLARIIQDLAKAINAAALMLKKPNGMNRHIVEIHRLENEADDVYFRAIGELFRNETDPIRLIKWKELRDLEMGTTVAKASQHHESISFENTIIRL